MSQKISTPASSFAEPDHILLQARNVEFDWSDLPCTGFRAIRSAHTFSTCSICSSLPVRNGLSRPSRKLFPSSRTRSSVKTSSDSSAKRRCTPTRTRRPGPSQGERPRSDAVHPADGMDLFETARTASDDRTACRESPGGALGDHRGNRTHHGFSRRLGAQRQGTRQSRYAPDHARSAPLARCRGGRTPLRRVRRDALLRQARDTPHPNPDRRHAGTGVAVDSWHQVPDAQRSRTCRSGPQPSTPPPVRFHRGG